MSNLVSRKSQENSNKIVKGIKRFVKDLKSLRKPG
jgi:hypothetical protein